MKTKKKKKNEKKKEKKNEKKRKNVMSLYFVTLQVSVAETFL